MNLQNILIFASAILYALTIHEFCHALVADRFGDSTPRSQGRLTLNPIAHLDLIGTLCFIFASFGWGKPVPVNPDNFKNPMRDNMFVSLAGPASNFVSAFAFGMIFQLLHRFIMSPSTLTAPIMEFLYFGITINLFLAFFNLIPLFPLDGSHILKGLLPYYMIPRFENISKYSPFILLGLIILARPTGVSVLGLILHPPVSFFSRIFSGM